MSVEGMYFTYVVSPNAMQSVPRLLAQLLVSLRPAVAATHALAGSAAPNLVAYRWRALDQAQLRFDLGSKYPLYRRACRRLGNNTMLAITAGGVLELREARPRGRIIYWVHSAESRDVSPFLRRADVVVTPSVALLEELNNPPHGRVIYNWIDTATFHARRTRKERVAVRTTLGIDPDARVIIHAGSDKPRKGGDVVQRELAEAGTEAVYLRCGSASEGTERIGRLTIVRVGRLNPGSLAALYRASDVGVVPSQYPDPYPTVVLEMLATGTPVVGSDIGGIHEMLGRNPAGRLVDLTGSWASAVEEADALDRDSGPRWIAEHATLERATVEWLSLL